MQTTDIVNDLPLAKRLAHLHYSEIGDSEFSKKLGLPALEVFYRTLVSSRYGEVFYSDAKSGEILSICCVISDIVAFNVELKKNLLWQVIFRILSLRLSIITVLKELRRQNDKPSFQNAKCHLGMIVRNSNFEPISTFKLAQNFKEGMDYAAALGCCSIWASAQRENEPSIKFLTSHQFKIISNEGDFVYLEADLKNKNPI